MIWLWPVLMLASAAPWPPAHLTADEAGRVQRGEAIQHRELRNSEIHYAITARIEATPAEVFPVARDLCLRPPPENKPTIRLLAPEIAERTVEACKGKLDDEIFASLPSLSCQDASARTVYYVYWMAPGRLLFPDMSAVMRQHNSAQANGSYLLRTEQVAGGMGDKAKMDSEVLLIPMPDGTTAWVSRGVFGLPSFIPDFLIRRMMNTPDDENPQLKQLERLRTQVRERRGRVPAPPAATLQPQKKP